MEMRWKGPELEAACAHQSLAQAPGDVLPAPRGAVTLPLPRQELAGGDGQLLLHNHLSTTDNTLKLIFRRHLGKKNAFTTAETPG